MEGQNYSVKERLEQLEALMGKYTAGGKDLCVAFSGGATQNLINTVVEAANGHDVTDSVINGKIVMKDREVLTLDEEKIRREAQIHMEEIIKRAY